MNYLFKRIGIAIAGLLAMLLVAMPASASMSPGAHITAVIAADFAPLPALAAVAGETAGKIATDGGDIYATTPTEPRVPVDRRSCSVLPHSYHYSLASLTLQRGPVTGNGRARSVAAS